MIGLYKHIKRQNSLYTVINVISIVTALFIYLIVYYLEITWNEIF